MEQLVKEGKVIIPGAAISLPGMLKRTIRPKEKTFTRLVSDKAYIICVTDTLNLKLYPAVKAMGMGLYPEPLGGGILCEYLMVKKKEKNTCAFIKSAENFVPSLSL